MSVTSEELVQKIIDDDPRYHPNAYFFLLKALNVTIWEKKQDVDEKLDETEIRHVSGQQLLEGIRILALKEFGYLARAVFNCWGIVETYCWGEIVYNMISKKLLTKSDKDNRLDFKDVFDFEDALDKAFFSEEYYKISDDTVLI